MKLKRLFTALLAAALTVGLMVPAGAVKSSFNDISDQSTAVNADILRLMGVVSGSGDNRFDPSSNLTRAQFCAMVVNFMGLGDSVVLHSTRTIFSDVTAGHWARGYVNLAASTQIGDKDHPTPLISGVGDGRFEPDVNITFAQAVTILIRVLNYTGDQVGAVWPQGYLNLAQSIGLTRSLSLSPGSAITRAQAAQLFVNALSCKTGSGAEYYTTLKDATVKEDAILLAVNAKTDDGSQQGAIRTSAGSYLPKVEGVVPAALAGQRGALVLNDRSEIISFVPDDTTAVTVVLSGAAEASSVKAADGTKYTIPASTPVYTASKEESDPYSSAFTQLYSGSQLTLFTERGKVVAVYSSSGTSINSDAVVVTDNVSPATFHQLTGGITNFSIQKNRQAIRLSDIKPYDVVTYDSVNNTLIVSDLRLTCIYEDAAPNAKAPSTITVLGHEFPVLESAWDTTKDFALGNSVTLLLTADGKVAGLAEPDSKTRTNAVGMVDDKGAQMFLPSGGSITLSGTLSNSDAVKHQLVNFSSSARGKLTASRLPGLSAPGSFDIDGMTLGHYTVAAGVKVYEQVSDGNMVAVSLSGLDMGSISESKISTYHLNSSNMVDYIVLKNATGDAYEYGMLIVTTVKTQKRDENGYLVFDKDNQPVYDESRSLALVNGSHGTMELPNAGYNGKTGTFAGVALANDSRLRDLVELTEIKDVSPSDFFQSQGSTYVTVNGKTYKVADDVECYTQPDHNKFSEDNWFRQDSGEDRLNACKAAASDLTLYIDPVGEKVRIVVAESHS